MKIKRNFRSFPPLSKKFSLDIEHYFNNFILSDYFETLNYQPLHLNCDPNKGYHFLESDCFLRPNQYLTPVLNPPLFYFRTRPIL